MSPSPPPAADRDARLAAAVRNLDGHFSVAVLDVADGTGATYEAGDSGTTYDTASIVKVDILAALLLQAQDAGRTLTAQERAHAAVMIRSSDNAAATALWDAIGGADGLDAANARLGLTGTSGGDGPRWGLTRTTASDQLALLKQVFGVDESVLGEASWTYVHELMATVERDQAWGVSAAGSAGAALKNGWRSRSADGLWDINSVGRVTAAGRHNLVAVVSQGNATKEAGIALVEAVAQVAVAVVSAGA
ncbi:serine hydrolase [Streptomyces sp. SID14478]|uniref:serine hydrolase n=1 Tax=Streptomyces sp. SID14478 TaxID=2706073 RepID=UPI0031B9D2D7